MPPVDNTARDLRRNAPLFAALGDETRLALLTRLGEHGSASITRLAEGAPVTRQAITKHLRVLEDAGLVRVERRGREQVFELLPAPFAAARRSLDAIARQWDAALARLKAHVET